MPTIYDSLRNENQFRFTCPIFNAETRMGACTQLRDMVYMGNPPPDKRLGCQAAMRCGKCPAAVMVSMYCFNKNWTNDHHGSIEPKQGKLMKQVLERVLKPIMLDTIMNGFNISEKERELLLTANDRIAQQLKTAPGESTKSGRSVEAKSVSRQFGKEISEKKDEKTVEASAINKAAMTGDLAAAINA